MCLALAELNARASPYGLKQATDEQIVCGFLAFMAERATRTSTTRLARTLYAAAGWPGDPSRASRVELMLRNLAAYPINMVEYVLASAAHSMFLWLLRGDALPVVRSADRVIEATDWPQLLTFINMNTSQVIQELQYKMNIGKGSNVVWLLQNLAARNSKRPEFSMVMRQLLEHATQNKLMKASELADIQKTLQ
jgi:hypothetical protein